MKIDSSKSEYNLKLPSGTHSILFYPKFEDDKLIQLRLQISPRTVVGRDLRQLYQEVLQVYKVKHGNYLLEKK
ncbi:MAG: hypothetical protein ACJAZY_003320 [Spirosomataceae bacterium]|jgi:hypothetical protein